MKTTVCRG